MARLEVSDLDGLIIDLDDLANLPEDLIDEMLFAEGEVVAKAHKASIRKHRLYKTGLLESSITIAKKVKVRRGYYGDTERYISVYPQGRHHVANRRVVTKKYSRSRSGRTYTVGGDSKVVTNNDVAFVHEFGAPRRNIKATQWMREANESSAIEAVNAAEKIYDEYLKSKSL